MSTKTLTGRTFIIPVSNGIFAHRERIGAAIWVFLWLIDHTTKEVPAADGKVDGLVLDGRPIPFGEMTSELALCPRAVADHLSQLAEAGYIRKIDKGAGRPKGYVVINSRRANPRKRADDTPGTPAEKGRGTQAEKGRGAEGDPGRKRYQPRQKKVLTQAKKRIAIKETHHTHHTHHSLAPVPTEPVAELVLTPQNPEPKTDSRWKPCIQILAEYWKATNPALPFPFGKPGGEQLKKFLANNPELSPEQFAGLVRNRSLSEENHGEPAHIWLSGAMRYVTPLNRYGDPLAGFSPPKRKLRCVDDPPTPINHGARNAITR